MNKIPFIKPMMPSPEEMKTDWEEISSSGIYSNSGQFEKRFKEKLEEYLGQGIKASIINNATIALMMAVRNMFLPNKKKVIIQSFTFCAGAHAILWSFYEPVFIDIQEEDWQPNLDEARQYLVSNHDQVAGIIVCNTLGTPCKDIENWEKLAKEYNLPLIIDSAAGLGSIYQDGTKIGGRGDCEIFSFHATKPFGIGEGGAITSRNDTLIQKFEDMKNFSFHGDRSAKFLGLNAKLPEISSAIAIRVLEKFDERLKVRRSNLALYKKKLLPKGIKFQMFDELSTVPFVSVLANDGKKIIMENIAKNNIGVHEYYVPPIHEQPLFKEFEKPSDLKETNEICRKIIALPMHEKLSEEDISKISSYFV